MKSYIKIKRKLNKEITGLLDFLSDRPSRRTIKYLLIISFLLLIISAPTVIFLLELSNYGGELNETQLGFDGKYIKSNFSFMTSEDISIFIIANLFDYVFMIAYGSFLFSSALTLARKLREDSIWRKIGYFTSILGVAAACCDGMENVFLLTMASNPSNFPNWLAIPHSSFALAKFIFMFTAVGGLVLTAISAVAYGLKKRQE